MRKANTDLIMTLGGMKSQLQVLNMVINKLSETIFGSCTVIGS
jgi:hypothetical protein